ncbi:YheC/YheD family endospore coat-associated protein [Desmospora profundinema]|uniref:YheC/YheD family protein n=1 Tax=Desmospora profundinema TaxID=1571184 RepID=A0ABU1IPL0_9BACL|nr:YheC/YheD family protein [Desmospora profundinema]MDR6226656.1 hypothetical protein [Desmospora profundinema]
MTKSKAGWLVVQPGGNRFVPHPRLWKGEAPSKMPIFWGEKPRRVLPVQTAPLGKDSHHHLPARLMETPSGSFRAGPFLAILTSADKGSFRGNRDNFRDIIQAGRRLGVSVYVLTPEGIRGKGQLVKGFLLDSRRGTIRWVHATLPMPDVVYNRIPSRWAEQKTAEQNALRFFSQHPHIHLFNPGFFDKWTLYTYLERSPKLRALLPDTAAWGNPEDFRRLASRHDTLFLKPTDGKAGKGMIRIRKRGNRYEVIHQHTNPPAIYTCASWRDLSQRVNSLVRSKKYVVQQGVALARYQGRPFDLRLLVQKDQQGEWACTGIGIRVAGSRAISTHVPMGGTIANADVVLKEVSGEQADELKEQIQMTGLTIARHIEAEEGKNLGEMSMDLGLDEKGKLWFFEANAKPMKFDEPDIRRRSLEAIIRYAVYVSGFGQWRRTGD